VIIDTDTLATLPRRELGADMPRRSNTGSSATSISSNGSMPKTAPSISSTRRR